MRTRSLIPVALLGSAALALVAVSPAYAADATWTQPNDSWWSTADWNGGGPPDATDRVIFDGGPRSTYNLGDLSFLELRFKQNHWIANGGGAIDLTDGIIVDPGVIATIEPRASTSEDQTWTVPAGAELNMPSLINVDGATSLTLDIDGRMAVGGDLDGHATACVAKTGSGVLDFIGNAGGGLGACSTDPAGLLVTEGSVNIAPGSNLGGKDFAISGGMITGGAWGSPGVVHALSLAPGGTVSPGTGSGPVGVLHLWGTSTWNGGTYVVDVDPLTLQADLVEGVNQAIAVNGTVLSPRAPAGVPDPQNEVVFEVLVSNVGVSGAFVSPAGETLADGDEFVANGQLWRYGQDELTVTLTWLGAAPEPEPETPTMPNPTPPAKVYTAAASVTRIWR